MRARRRSALLASCLALLAAGAAVADDRPLIGPRARTYAVFLEAQNLLLAGRADEAARLLDAAVSADPDPGLLLEAARMHELLGEPDQALPLADRALLARPGWPEALVLRAGLRLDRDDEPAPEHRLASLADLRVALATDPSSEEGARRLAAICAGSDCAGEAARVLEAQRANRVLPVDLALALARLDLEIGKVEECRAILTEILQRDPGNLEAADTLATLFEAAERYTEAIAVYASLLDEDQPSAPILKRIALLQMELERPADAIETLLAAEEADPADHRIRLLMAQVRDSAGDADGARADCERFLLVEPENLDGLFERARLLRRQGEGAASRRAFEDLIARAARQPLPEPQGTTMITVAWAQVGVLAASARDWDGAARALAQAVALAHDPQDDLLRLLARTHLERGDADAAERVAAAGLLRSPESEAFETLLAEALLVRGEEAKASAALTAILARHGHSIEATLGIADTLMRRKRFAEGRDILVDALRRHPGDDRLLFAHGAVLERLGRFEEAERALGRAVVANPNNAMALNYLGYMLAQRGRRLPDSVLYVERAVALDPGNPAYLDSLGFALFKLARYVQAEEMLRTALRYDSFDPAIRDHLGDLLVATGRPAEAMREWEAAIACGHEEPDRIRAKVSRARRALVSGR